jgi:sulfur carrier protein ThiS
MEPLVFSQAAVYPQSAVAKIIDLAQHAGVTPRVVLDVVNGRPINEDAQRRVAAAIEALGQPDRPVGAFRHVDVVPAESGHGAVNGDLARRDETALVEDLMTEVRPVGAKLDRLDAAVTEVIGRLDVERRDRVADLELLSELVIEGWRGIDRRLGRLEKTIARIDEQNVTSARRAVKRLEDWVRDPAED